MTYNEVKNSMYFQAVFKRVEGYHDLQWAICGCEYSTIIYTYCKELAANFSTKVTNSDGNVAKD